VFLLFVVLTFLGESFAGSGLFILPLVEEASLLEALLTCFYLLFSHQHLHAIVYLFFYLFIHFVLEWMEN
jgi:hypothetical protein